MRLKYTSWSLVHLNCRANCEWMSKSRKKKYKCRQTKLYKIDIVVYNKFHEFCNFCIPWMDRGNSRTIRWLSKQIRNRYYTTWFISSFYLIPIVTADRYVVENAFPPILMQRPGDSRKETNLNSGEGRWNSPWTRRLRPFSALQLQWPAERERMGNRGQ